MGLRLQFDEDVGGTTAYKPERYNTRLVTIRGLVAAVVSPHAEERLGRKGLEAPDNRCPAERVEEHARAKSVQEARKLWRSVSMALADAPAWRALLVIAPLTILASAFGEYAISEHWLGPAPR
jgi:hypothetical protein